MPQEGLEPPRANAHYALNVARLPIPPLRLNLFRNSKRSIVQPLGSVKLSGLTTATICRFDFLLALIQAALGAPPAAPDFPALYVSECTNRQKS
jgi:hypothetical protein